MREGRWTHDTKPPSVDVNELMVRVRSRDVAAFECVYETFQRLVYGIAFRMLGDAAGAEDLTQAVFMKIWLSPESYAGGNFSAWISRVTRNRALDVLRVRNVRQEGEIPFDAALEESLDETVFARLDGQRVRDALSQLPDDQRSAIELGFFGGITHEEIARRTATPLGTVKTRIRSGLRKMRAALETAVAS